MSANIYHVKEGYTSLQDDVHVTKKGPSIHSYDPLSFQKTAFDTNAKVTEAAKISCLKSSQIIRNATRICVVILVEYICQDLNQKTKKLANKSE